MIHNTRCLMKKRKLSSDESRDSLEETTLSPNINVKGKSHIKSKFIQTAEGVLLMAPQVMQSK